MGRDGNEPLYDDNPWSDANAEGTMASSGRMSPTMRGAIIIVALLAVIAIAGAVIAVALRGGDDDANSASPTSEAAVGGSTPATDTEADEESPAVDSVAILEGAGFDVVMSGPAPEAVERWGDYELVRSANERVRVFDGSEPSRATLDGGQWPMTMNDCGIVSYLVVFRGANENVMLNASLLNSAYLVADEEQASQGWMLLTNCATPQWEFLSSTDQGNLADVIYDVHEYRQSATAAPGGTSDGTNLEAQDGGSEMKHFYYCVADSPGQAIMTDGSTGYEPYCVENPEATRASLGERCCGGLDGSSLCGEELWFDVCRTRPPGW